MSPAPRSWWSSISTEHRVKRTEGKFSFPLHAVALATTVATFPLIFMGGLVTSHQAGMSVPDWPNSYGYNMFLFPPSKWVGGIFYEHTHRLMGTVVGMLAIALVIVAWKVEPRRWVRWLATSVLAAVILQGILGGLRVVLKELDLAVVHACFAQAFFCLAALCAIVTGRRWLESPKLSRSTDAKSGQRLAALGAACVLLVFCQLVVGALMRHYEAGLAIPGVSVYGKLTPPADAAGLDAINRTRAWELGLKPVTLSQLWLHFGHRLGAVAVTIAIAATVAVVLVRHRRSALVVPAIFLAALLVAQATLGVLTVYFGKPADIASAHVAVGALVLVTAFVLTVRVIRLYGWSGASVSQQHRLSTGLVPA